MSALRRSPCRRRRLAGLSSADAALSLASQPYPVLSKRNRCRGGGPETGDPALTDTNDRPKSASGSPLEAWVEEAYDTLRGIAADRLRPLRGQRTHTLQPTAIVHEAYVKLAADPGRRFPGRPQFLAYAAQVVRSVLVDHARRRSARPEGRGSIVIEEQAVVAPDGPNAIDLLALDDALQRLAADHERVARVVELRFFGGLTIAEISFVCEVSTRTVDQDWAFGRAFLSRSLAGGSGDDEGATDDG